MKKIPITLKFWFGCFVILVASILQVVYPWFLGLGPIVIIFALGFCIWQWHRKVLQLKDFIAAHGFQEVRNWKLNWSMSLGFALMYFDPR